MNTTKTLPALPIEAHTIATMLPHRFPFLPVDRVTEYAVGKRVRAIKNVTVHEPFFSGHSPDHPVLPAVRIVGWLAPARALVSQR